MTICFSGPLFTLAERSLSRALAKAVQKRFPQLEIILPREFGAKLAGSADWLTDMLVCCISSLEKADIVIAILDGADADSGTGIEAGYARAKGKSVIGE